MSQVSDVFEKNYDHYLEQLASCDLGSVKDRLGAVQDGTHLIIPLFDREYRISKGDIIDETSQRPDYVTCVILAKYVLLCPDVIHEDPNWVSFQDFKKYSHLTNLNYFKSDTERVIKKHFTGKLDQLTDAGAALGGIQEDVGTSYDLSMRFKALPRISLLLLFNDGDEEFPASCSVLFQQHAEFYLDPESLAMTSASLAKNLKRKSREISGG